MSKANFCMAAFIAFTQSLLISTTALAQDDTMPRFIPEPEVKTQAETDLCAQARDPANCAARQAALALCADKRGNEKQACLQENLPPVDCSQEDNPEECFAIQKAKEQCAGKKDAALTACLHPGERTAKNKHGKKKAHKASAGSKNTKAASANKRGKANAKASAKTNKPSPKKEASKAKGNSAAKTATKKTAGKKPRQTP
ncbi:MAG: hypothetical protein WA112_05470 [Rugosibacter sp.]|jgi:hypothetical protein|nr:hypothetical protein [Rugosibacter sp.]